MFIYFSNDSFYNKKEWALFPCILLFRVTVTNLFLQQSGIQGSLKVRNKNIEGSSH